MALAPGGSERIYRDDRFRLLDPETALVLNEIMNANLEIDVDGKEMKVDMCAGIENLKREAAKNAAVLASVEAWREVEVPENEIKNRIMFKYNLTEDETIKFMSNEGVD